MFPTATAFALANPLFTGVLVAAVASGVLAFQQVWILLGPREPKGGGQYTAWLEARSNRLENTLRMYGSPTFNDGGAEARRVLDQLNGDQP